jgi:oligopeptide transport system ATP-binding protein
MSTLLEVTDLKTYFYTQEGVIRAVDNVSFDVRDGETLAIVGESGSGKSVTALSVMRLVAEPPGRIVQGSILFEGLDLLQLSSAEMRKIRGDRIAMIFQEPMSSLNPVLTIGDQLCEALKLHRGMNHTAARARAVELLQLVSIPEAEKRLDQYPHQFSGGMRQRIMIAMGMSCQPKLLIADEPTTALDVTIQAQVLELIKQLSAEMGTAVILITHNLGIVARYADRVNVMYAGRIVEQATADDLYANPAHPYTLGLLRSVPPDMADPPVGCRFRPRCPFAQEKCASEYPPLFDLGSGHKTACWVDVETGELRKNKEVVGVH